MKLYLNCSSVGDLQTVHEKFTLAVINQKSELEILQLSEGQKSPIFAKQKLYTNLNGKVAHFALRLIHQQHKKMLLSMDREEQPVKPCRQIFERTMGLPCAHHLFDIIAAHDGVIPLVEVNDFWQYNPNEMSFIPQLEPPMITDSAAAVIFEIQEQLPEVNQVRQQAVQHHLEQAANALVQPILPPAQQKTRGQPPGALNNNTRRDPSGFEVVTVCLLAVQLVTDDALTAM
jgi:hypothetical protein